MSTVTRESIDNRISQITYQRIPGTTVTICAIRMVNGFVVTGDSACVKIEDFDIKTGQELAFDNAYEKLWALEGYLAAERKHLSETTGAQHGNSDDNDF